MTKVLITGATGNVGTEVIKSLQNLDHPLDIYAGVRNSTEDRNKIASYKVKFLQFDFTDFTTHNTALEGCDIVFLLRPLQNFRSKKNFKPINDTWKQKRWTATFYSPFTRRNFLHFGRRLLISSWRGATKFESRRHYLFTKTS